MNRVSLGCVGLLCVLSGCSSHPPLSNGNVATARAPVFLGQMPRRFSIATADAPVALTEFSRQADLQVLFDYRQLSGRRTHPIEGQWEPLYALNDMLKDSGLVFVWVNERTLAISPAPSHP